jgi:hypothetical protein
MRRTKMLGLVAVAALACMALVGSSSAFAKETVLCSSNTGSACPSGETYQAGTALKASASETVKFETSWEPSNAQNPLSKGKPAQPAVNPPRRSLSLDARGMQTGNRQMHCQSPAPSLQRFRCLRR